MDEITIVNQTNNQAHFDYDNSKVFICDNRYDTATFRNLTAGALDFKVGTVLGRISSTGKVTEMKSGGTDGSQFPVGILATDIVQLAATSDIEVSMCISGDVAEEKVLLNDTDTLLTAVDDKIYRDRIGADTVGIILKAGTELTNFDNQ